MSTSLASTGMWRNCEIILLAFFYLLPTHPSQNPTCFLGISCRLYSVFFHIMNCAMRFQFAMIGALSAHLTRFGGIYIWLLCKNTLPPSLLHPIGNAYFEMLSHRSWFVEFVATVLPEREIRVNSLSRYCWPHFALDIFQSGKLLVSCRCSGFIHQSCLNILRLKSSGLNQCLHCRFRYLLSDTGFCPFSTRWVQLVNTSAELSGILHSELLFCYRL